MGRCIELRLGDDDRERYGGPEWTTLDIDRLFETPSATLERWESETDYGIELALARCLQSPHPPARAVRVLMWLARKQHGANADAVDPDTGRPESFARLAEMRSMQVRLRDASTAEGDADPPEQPAPGH